MKEIWARIGMTIRMTDEEAKTLLNQTIHGSVLENIFLSGRIIPDGDCYIPDQSVEDFFEVYGNPDDVPVEEISFDWYGLDGFRALSKEQIDKLKTEYAEAKQTKARAETAMEKYPGLEDPAVYELEGFMSGLKMVLDMIGIEVS